MNKKMVSIGFIVLLSISYTISSVGQNENNIKVSDVCISKEELKLFKLISEYRKSKGLKEIPFSKSLTFVAQTHVRDLENNSPAQGNCNMHSWSDKGNWTPCCYTSDHAKASCMWDKPKELTNYKGNGFEISSGGSGNYIITAEAALKSWKGSNGHNAVIINLGIWKNSPWQAIGIGIYGSYAVVWFGKLKDPEGPPFLCKE